MSDTTDKEFQVEDRRRGTFGVVHRSDWDCEDFRSLTTAHRCVYVTLCMYAGRYTQACFPKVSTLCKVTGLSRATVFRALTELERIKRIERSKRFINSARRVNLYILK
jgi:hypothetical protein